LQGSVNNFIFGIAPDTVYPVIIIMLVILLFEWAGGLSSVVALTDAIQGFVMVAVYFFLPYLPSIIKRTHLWWMERLGTQHTSP
jgi:Na+/proline symporter